MPDFEIRYFNADGSLALVHISNHATVDDAAEHAKRNLGSHARFEIRDGDGSPLPEN